MRIDKFIWCVRLFKTRSLASKACGSDKVKLKDIIVKASKEVTNGATFSFKDVSIWRSYKVLDIPKSRVGAKLVPDYIIETTNEDELLQLKQIQEVNRVNNSLGIKGRPTKKERRDLDKLWE